jgi:phosphopantetheine adenylyltransferase
MKTIRACAAVLGAKYAQPGGGAREVVELEVVVVDPKTRKASNRVFTITDKTRILRGSKPVKVADVSARKDEKVAVVVDHDKPGDEAIEVRFEAAQ